MTRADFDALYDEVATSARWSEHGERGTLNYLTPQRIAAAARLVREGVTVSLGLPLATEERIDNPQPAVHRMTLLPDANTGSGPVRFAKDYVGVDFHNEGHSHIDALSHVSFRDCFYGGRSTRSVTEDGADAGAIDLVANGLIGRGVLVDVPRSRGVDWLEPGDQVVVADLEAALRLQDVTVMPGDILLVRTGHARRRADLPPWDTSRAKAGVHAEVARFLASRRVAALGSDGNNDAVPSTVEGVGFPIHVLAVHAMGMHLLDYLQFEDLADACQRRRRWEFLCVVAPLRIDGGTGSPVNPIAVF
jgi:kynurenine formamidase